MTPEQFYDPDEMQQAEVIREGKHIADRQDNEHNILLYKIGWFVCRSFLFQGAQLYNRIQSA